MADDEIRDTEAADDLDPAFDSIDATMKDGARRNIKVTPEKLAQIVNEAVEKAITAYEQSRGTTPESAGTPEQSPAVPASPWRSKMEQLKGDMGIDEIEFDGPPVEAAETRVHRELSSQMGVHDFEFEDAPGTAAERDAPTRTEADALAGWTLQAEDPSPAAPVADETPAPAAAEEHAVDEPPAFDWVAAELGQLDADETPTPVSLEPERNQAPEAVAPAIAAPPAAPAQEVRETRGGLTGWLRSAIGSKAPERAAVAAVPAEVSIHIPAPLSAAPEPVPPVMPVAPAAPPPRETIVAAPPPVAAAIAAAPPPVVVRPEEPHTVHFTFDPILPVPPRMPREPEEPPKKIKKSGTFL